MIFSSVYSNTSSNAWWSIDHPKSNLFHFFVLVTFHNKLSPFSICKHLFLLNGKVPSLTFLLVVPRVNVWVPFFFFFYFFFFFNVAISDSVKWLPYLGFVPGPTRTTSKGTSKVMSLLFSQFSQNAFFSNFIETMPIIMGKKIILLFFVLLTFHWKQLPLNQFVSPQMVYKMTTIFPIFKSFWR